MVGSRPSLGPTPTATQSRRLGPRADPPTHPSSCSLSPHPIPTAASRYKFDDSHTSSVEPEAVVTPAAYVLIYLKRGLVDALAGRQPSPVVQ